MHFLYPSDPFKRSAPEENYAAEHAAAISAGHTASLFSFEDFDGGEFQVRPALPSSAVVCYRGWMLSPDDYRRLIAAISDAGAIPLTSAAQYERCHYLPGWYENLRDVTPETLFFKESDDVAVALRQVGWTGCFLKDYVKSLSTAGGSLVTDLGKIPEVVSKMKKYRGKIEGGLCARKIENFDPSTECRHFVFKGQAFSPPDSYCDLVAVAAKEIDSPFYSVDVIKTREGAWRIVELGDGQVSDVKSWSPEEFIQIFC